MGIIWPKIKNHVTILYKTSEPSMISSHNRILYGIHVTPRSQALFTLAEGTQDTYIYKARTRYAARMTLNAPPTKLEDYIQLAKALRNNTLYYGHAVNVILEEREYSLWEKHLKNTFI